MAEETKPTTGAKGTDPKHPAPAAKAPAPRPAMAREGAAPASGCCDRLCYRDPWGQFVALPLVTLWAGRPVTAGETITVYGPDGEYSCQVIPCPTMPE